MKLIPTKFYKESIKIVETVESQPYVTEKSKPNSIRTENHTVQFGSVKKHT